MIPIKIQIKNFLSYGQELQTIDFSSYHLLCLSGKNGHGKSALLDAITWAIWGQARKTSGTIKADNGLLRLGQTHMLVIIDFLCNDNHYRIRREFAHTHGKPYAALDFGIVHEQNDTIIPLTEKKIRETQKKIENTIHLDYDAFINSAFLRQGHANEFSKKSAKDRKEILANILGLQRYEAMRKAANDKAREAITQKQQLVALQEKISLELEKSEQIKKEMEHLKTGLCTLNTTEKDIATKHQALQKDRENLFKMQESKKQGIKQLNEITEHQNRLQKQLRDIFTTWRKIHKQQLDITSLQSLKKEKEHLVQEIKKWQDAFSKKLEKKEQYLKEKELCNQLEQKLQLEQSKQIQLSELQIQQLHMTCKQNEQQYEQLNKDEIVINKELHEINNKIKTLQAACDQRQQKQTLSTIEKQFEKRRNHYQKWIAQANHLKNELQQIKQKRAFVHDENSPSCPLCEQNLSVARKKFLKSKIDTNEQRLMHQYKRLSQLIHKLKSILTEQHTQLEKIRKEQTQLQVDLHQKEEAEKKNTHIVASINDLKKQQAILTKAIEQQQQRIKIEQAKLNKAKDSIEENIKSDPAYIKKATELQTIQKLFNAIAYDQTAHKKTSNRLQEVETQLISFDALQRDVHMQDERKKQINELCIQLKKIKIDIKRIEKESKRFENLKELEQAYKNQETVLLEKQRANNAEKEKLLQQKGRLEQQQAMLKKLRVEQKEHKKKISSLKQIADDFQLVATALGKNGIQALLIEDAIPEIEQEANELLSKLTDNQAQICIESLRDLKSGGTRETLDIKISDAAGMRPYELFSGGEAFRIDFALRIAISKLLARRAGTSLQTLIIDEGFGSQDEEGLSHIMDAIYKIQDNFKKVIIVSHLPRLKDQFPVHFYVQKGPQGSHVNVIEQA